MRKVLFLLILLPVVTRSQLSLAPVFQNNMVIQADHSFDFFGKGNPGGFLRVRVLAHEFKTTIAQDSNWRISVFAQKASQSSTNIQFITEKDTLILANILFGDVWLCIGQSNMEFPLRSDLNYKPADTKDEIPQLRFYSPQYIGKNLYGKPYTDSMKTRLQNRDVLTGRWESSNARASAEMSAIGYYFGRSITEELKRPAGIIHLSIGGSPIETWINSQALSSSPEFHSKTEKNWMQNSALPVWIRQRAIENIGTADPDGPHTFQSGFAFEHLIKPLTVLPIRGILFYQGESNAQEIERVTEYAALMQVLVKNYRLEWDAPTLPFYFVQLSSIDSVKYKSQYWPQFRAEQLKAMQSIPHTGMAVSHDKGSLNDVHPTDKKTIAERLYRWAARQAYSQQNLLPSGPLPKRIKLRNNKLIICFEYCGKGLKTNDGNQVHGFSLDGIHEVTAFIKRNKVYIPTKIAHGTLQYCFQPYCTANLTNSEGLPTPGFRMDF